MTRSDTLAKCAAVLLVALGLSRMLADLAGWNALAGALGASMIAPAPKVFSSAKGLETFSTRFFLEFHGADGERQRVALDSARYAGIDGPYQRRNVYGAALAYGPVLASTDTSRAMLHAVLRYGLAGDAPLLRELELDPSEVRGAIELVYEPREGSVLDDLPLRIVVPARVGEAP